MSRASRKWFDEAIKSNHYGFYDVQVMIDEAGWQDWMDGFTESEDGEEISEAEGDSIEEEIKWLWHEFWGDFNLGFIESMPLEYIEADDIKTDKPLCRPWLWTKTEDYKVNGLNGYELGERWASIVAPKFNELNAE